MSIDLQTLPGLNKPALVRFFGLPARPEKLYKNTEVCADCNITSFESGIVEFTVQDFNGTYGLTAKLPSQKGFPEIPIIWVVVVIGSGTSYF